MHNLRERLDDLQRRSGRTPTPPATPAAPGPRARLEDVLGGQERSAGRHAYWYLQTPFDQACPQHAADGEVIRGPLHPDLGTGEAALVDPRRAVVIDIETGGFSGTPVFLIGAAPLDSQPLAVHQFLARDYPEEEAILRELAGWAEPRDTWITFNGKAFDLPFLLDRARIYGITLRPPQVHVDLLVAARRRWRCGLPDRRLTTLEEHVLGRRRIGDIPGRDVPDLFHHFIKTGNAAPLRPVLEHNRLDVIASTELLLRLTQPC